MPARRNRQSAAVIHPVGQAPSRTVPTCRMHRQPHPFRQTPGLRPHEEKLPEDSSHAHRLPRTRPSKDLPRPSPTFGSMTLGPPARLPPKDPKGVGPPAPFSVGKLAHSHSLPLPLGDGGTGAGMARGGSRRTWLGPSSAEPVPRRGKRVIAVKYPSQPSGVQKPTSVPICWAEGRSGPIGFSPRLSLLSYWPASA